MAVGVLPFGDALVNNQAHGQKWPVAMASTFYERDERQIISEYQVEPGSPLQGWTLEGFERQFALTGVRYQGADRVTLHPHADVVFQAGDRLLLGSLEVIQRLRVLATTDVG